MKFLVIADLHEEESVLEKLPAILEQEKPDYLIIAGDFTKPGNSSISYAEDALDLYPKILAIPGNCDPYKVFELIEEREFSIHERRKELEDGLNIIGFGYSPITPFGTPGELDEEEILKHLSKLSIDEKTILITHAPPEGILDSNFKGDHIGSSSIKQIVEEKEPFLHLFAHVHECEGKEKQGNTTFIKIPPAKNGKALIIDIKNKKIESRTIIF